jgi:hypothetical protein
MATRRVSGRSRKKSSRSLCRAHHVKLTNILLDYILIIINKLPVDGKIDNAPLCSENAYQYGSVAQGMDEVVMSAVLWKSMWPEGDLLATVRVFLYIGT